MFAAPEQIALGNLLNAPLLVEESCKEGDVMPGDEVPPLEALLDRESLIVGDQDIALRGDRGKADCDEEAETQYQREGRCDPIQQRGRRYRWSKGINEEERIKRVQRGMAEGGQQCEDDDLSAESEKQGDDEYHANHAQNVAEASVALQHERLSLRQRQVLIWLSRSRLYETAIAPRSGTQHPLAPDEAKGIDNCYNGNEKRQGREKETQRYQGQTE